MSTAKCDNFTFFKVCKTKVLPTDLLHDQRRMSLLCRLPPQVHVRLAANQHLTCTCTTDTCQEHHPTLSHVVIVFVIDTGINENGPTCCADSALPELYI